MYFFYITAVVVIVETHLDNIFFVVFYRSKMTILMSIGSLIRITKNYLDRNLPIKNLILLIPVEYIFDTRPVLFYFQLTNSMITS